MRIQTLPLIGRVGLCEEEETLTALVFAPSDKEARSSSPLLKEAFAQLKAYCEGQLRNFELPLAAASTPFQSIVRQALEKIPYGQTLTYKELAQQIEKPTACRAVGTACKRNPLPILVPCHRIVGIRAPDLYRGGPARKRALLALERNIASKE